MDGGFCGVCFHRPRHFFHLKNVKKRTHCYFVEKYGVVLGVQVVVVGVLPADRCILLRVVDPLVDTSGTLV